MTDEGQSPTQVIHARSGFDQALSLELVEATGTQTVAELRIEDKHKQPWGIVHGGVYCAMAETVCSLGAQLALSGIAGFVVGVDNHTSFLKATRSGTLRATARPIQTGRRTQLWQADIENESGTLVATARVRLMVVEAGQRLAGEVTPSRP